MHWLIINNSTSKIEGLTIEEFKALKELMFYTTSAAANYFSKRFGSPKRYLIAKDGSFPTGLLYIVIGFLSDKSYTIVDKRVKPEANLIPFILSKPLTPYPEQNNAATAVLERYRGIVSAPTGVGKSLIAVLIIQKLQVNTIVIVPSLELKRQLTETLAYYFGDIVGDLGSPIAICNIDSLDPKVTLKGYHCVIIDEFHHSGAKSYRQLNKYALKDVFYRVGLTATPFRSQDNEKLLLESVLSEVIFRITYKEAVDNGYIVPVKAYYVEVPTSTVKSNSWAGVYSELVVNNKERNLLIGALLTGLWFNKASTLCLVKEIKHGDNLNLISKMPFANGVHEETPMLIRGFNDRKLNSLIGTTGILGEGVDTKPAEWVIIAGLGKSKNAFMQQIGRGVRRYPGKETCKVVIFKDSSHVWTVRHFKAQCKILKEEYGVIPIKLEL